MIEFRIIRIDETDSTNRWMKELIQLHPSENTQHEMVVVCDYQTAGRGCGSNSWEAEQGKNLLMSVLMHPKKVWTELTIIRIVIPDILIVIAHFLDTEIGMLSYHVPRCPGKISLHLLECLVDIGIQIIAVWKFLVHNILVYNFIPLQN